MKRKICPSCKKRPKQKHHNSKWCVPCALEFRKRPKGSLTAAQKEWVKARIGKMPREQMAAALGVSISNLMRAFRGTRLAFYNKYAVNPNLVKQVTQYYEKHGRSKTAKAFPNVNVRSVVEHYRTFRPRQTRWKESEIILAAKMAGLVDGKRQARIFNRPGANEGSIKSLWMKRFGHGGGNIHGMSEWMAKEICRPGYPVLKTRCWSRRRGQPDRGPIRGLVLWSEMGPHLRRGTPMFVREAIKTLSSFQCWLFKSQTPQTEIRRLIRKLSNG